MYLYIQFVCDCIKICFYFLEMVHQQLQGIAKNKKNVGNTSRNKALQPILKSTNMNKEQSPNTKEILKKERRTTTIPVQSIVSK